MCAFTGTFHALQRQARGTLDGTNGPAMMTVYIQCVSPCERACVVAIPRALRPISRSYRCYLTKPTQTLLASHPSFFFVFSPPLSLLLADKRPWRSLTKQVGNTPFVLRSSAPPPCCLHLFSGCARAASWSHFFLHCLLMRFYIKVVHVAFIHDWILLPDM